MINLGVGNVPGRKKQALYLIDGTSITILAYFTSDKSVEAFMEAAKRGITVPGQQIVSGVYGGNSVDLDEVGMAR